MRESARDLCPVTAALPVGSSRPVFLVAFKVQHGDAALPESVVCLRNEVNKDEVYGIAFCSGGSSLQGCAVCAWRCAPPKIDLRNVLASIDN